MGRPRRAVNPSTGGVGGARLSRRGAVGAVQAGQGNGQGGAGGEEAADDGQDAHAHPSSADEGGGHDGHPVIGIPLSWTARKRSGEAGRPMRASHQKAPVKRSPMTARTA